MLRLSANITMLFTELPFLDRFPAAAAAGFTAIECIEPYVAPADVIAEHLTRHGLTAALFNMPPGNWAAGDRGIAADPERVDEFRASISTTLDYVRATGCRTLHLMAGMVPAGADRSVWTRTLVGNIRLAADTLAAEGCTIVLEPINSRVDMPGYFYDTSDAVSEVITATARENVKLLFDIYHAQIMEGDVARRLGRLMPHIGHIQIADTPDRHEPGSGELNFNYLLRRIDQMGYSGWVGCEYRPSGRTAEGLGWARDYLQGE